MIPIRLEGHQLTVPLGTNVHLSLEYSHTSEGRFTYPFEGCEPLTPTVAKRVFVDPVALAEGLGLHEGLLSGAQKKGKSIWLVTHIVNQMQRKAFGVAEIELLQAARTLEGPVRPRSPFERVQVDYDSGPEELRVHIVEDISEGAAPPATEVAILEEARRVEHPHLPWCLNSAVNCDGDEITHTITTTFNGLPIEQVWSRLNFQQQLSLFFGYFQALHFIGLKMGCLHTMLTRESLLGTIDGVGTVTHLRHALYLSNFQDRQFLTKTFFKRESPWIRSSDHLAPELLYLLLEIRNERHHHKVSLENLQKFPVTEKADIWSLGLTLALLLYDPHSDACPPFLRFYRTHDQKSPREKKREELRDIIQAHQEVPETDPSWSPLEKLLAQLLHPDPDQRPSALKAATELNQLMLHSLKAGKST